jgi:dienelactone hydrolase
MNERRLTRWVLALAALVATLLSAATARADGRLVATCTNIELFKPVAAYSWMGDSQAKPQVIVSRQDTCLNAVLYAPPEGVRTGTEPGIVIVQGAGGDSSELGWAGRYLAGHGYVALVIVQRDQGGSEMIAPEVPALFVDPAALLDGGERLTQVFPGLPPAFNMDNAVDAAESGIDFLLSSANPFPVDASRIGAAGHSEGARGVSAAQDLDGGPGGRIQAIVAFDNLTADWSGDEGVCSGGQPQSAVTGGQIPFSSYPITPRVPAMGQACDSGSTTLPPDAKEFAFGKWKAAGLPTAELVFAGWNHFAWANVPPPAANSNLDIEHQIASYYAGAWFDAYLRGDSTGITRLLADQLSGLDAANGSKKVDLLSTYFRSGVYLPDRGVTDCDDFRAGCP